ncbi:hypothetical protein [Candidatus Palauibacter sp.]|uniref:hypothetical protein n=1 Tax=Candidatus Palauibacter sp. TaxID=3101350 RepID=UPI003CC68D89
MNTVRWAALAVALATAACGTILGVFRDASLEVTVPSGERQVRWKDQRLALVNGLDDPKGLAGLEVEVGGRGVDRRVLTAQDLPSAPFEVPESGVIEIDVRLRLDGRAVSQGRASWDLEPDVEWKADILRAPFPGSPADNITGPNPIECRWWLWCAVWRFEIDADARNYEDEALWLTIWRVHPGECVDVC